MSNKSEICKWVKAARERRRAYRSFWKGGHTGAAIAMHYARYLKATGKTWVDPKAYEVWFYREGGAVVCAGAAGRAK